MERELIQGLDRWCLWMVDDVFDPQDILRPPILKGRVERARGFRPQSTKKATRDSADTPSSSMFITWQKAVGGRLKWGLNFANTLTWNTFSVPKLDDASEQTIIGGGKAVLDARARNLERSLAVHYDPLAMDPGLIRAHDKLDVAVDKAFGAPRRLST